MSTLKRPFTGLALVLLTATATTAFAQSDLSGSWVSIQHEDALERGPGPYQVDYTGLPLNEEGRAKALSYSASQYSMLERQCTPWPPHYIVMGPWGLRIWPVLDAINGRTISWTIGPFEDRGTTHIWMDDRLHPSANARHLQGGFTTGKWESGNTLVTRTTHMKAGAIRRNGAPSSDQEVMTMRLVRHGDLLTVLIIVEDPIYLSEPYMLSKTFRQAVDVQPLLPTGPPCTPAFEGASEDGRVPHILPDKNTAIDELMGLYGIPREAALGGAETMYPEFRKKLKDKFVRPAKCTANCGNAGVSRGSAGGGQATPPPSPPPETTGR